MKQNYCKLRCSKAAVRCQYSFTNYYTENRFIFTVAVDSPDVQSANTFLYQHHMQNSSIRSNSYEMRSTSVALDRLDLCCRLCILM